MVVVMALVELEDRLARLEMIARQQARLLELGQYAVDRRQTDVGALGKQGLVDILSSHVPQQGLLKKLQNLDARQRRFESAVLDLFGPGHGLSGSAPPPMGLPLESVDHSQLRPWSQPRLSKPQPCV